MGFGAGKIMKDPYNIHNMVGQEAATHIVQQARAQAMQARCRTPSQQQEEESLVGAASQSHHGQQGNRMSDALFSMVDRMFAGELDPGNDMLTQAALIQELRRP